MQKGTVITIVFDVETNMAGSGLTDGGDICHYVLSLSDERILGENVIVYGDQGRYL